MPAWMRSAVRIVTQHETPDFDAPWQTRASTSRGTGVVIGPGLVLCTADLVARAAAIRVQVPDRADTVIARVRAVNHECDLALLEVDKLLAQINPIQIAAMPQLWDEVAVINAAEDGQDASVTKGVVSRIAVERYTHSQRHLLVIVIDAATKLGAGPVIHDGRLVGVAIQRLSTESKSVELVPPPIITAFLDGVSKQRPPRVPGLGFTTQNLENPQLRAHVGLAASEHGVVVIQIEHGESAEGVLELGDVITSIDGLPIADNGLVTFMHEYAVRYDVVLGTHHVGDRVRLEIKRAGKRMVVELALKPYQPLVPRVAFDAPQFVVYGGLVFQRLTRDYLTTWDTWWNTAPKEFLNAYYLGRRTPAQHELVILSTILAADISVGYSHLYNEAVATLNGHVPRDMRDFYTRLIEARGAVRIQTTTGGLIVLDAAEVRAATPRILSEHNVPFASSIADG